jgi:hypothetical protein
MQKKWYLTPFSLTFFTPDTVAAERHLWPGTAARETEVAPDQQPAY